MQRPDQARFDLFSRLWESMDALLGEFAEGHQMQVEKNANRYPCRILRRQGNPELLIDIYQDDHWLEVDYGRDLPHSMAAVAFYELPQDHSCLWKMKEMLLEHQTFSAIRQRLEECLERSFHLLRSWTPEIIMRQGERCRNLKREPELVGRSAPG